jgi:hypothetical protein
MQAPVDAASWADRLLPLLQQQYEVTEDYANACIGVQNALTISHHEKPRTTTELVASRHYQDAYSKVRECLRSLEETAQDLENERNKQLLQEHLGRTQRIMGALRLRLYSNGIPKATENQGSSALVALATLRASIQRVAESLPSE